MKSSPPTRPVAGVSASDDPEVAEETETASLALSRDWTAEGAPVLTAKEKRVFAGRVAPALRSDDGHRPVTKVDRDGKVTGVARLKDVRHGITKLVGIEFDVETGLPEYAVCVGCQRPFCPENDHGDGERKLRKGTRQAKNCIDCFRPLCAAGCGKRVGASRMTPKLVRVRGGSPPCCSKTCGARKTNASKTPEQRSETIRKGKASMTPEQRSEIARKRQASKTPEQRSEATCKANASKTPEQRSEAARKAQASMTPEQRSEIARKRSAARTGEQRSDAGRKNWETRRANAAAKAKAKS